MIPKFLRERLAILGGWTCDWHNESLQNSYWKQRATKKCMIKINGWLWLILWLNQKAEVSSFDIIFDLMEFEFSIFEVLIRTFLVLMTTCSTWTAVTELARKYHCPTIFSSTLTLAILSNQMLKILLVWGYFKNRKSSYHCWLIDSFQLACYACHTSFSFLAPIMNLHAININFYFVKYVRTIAGCQVRHVRIWGYISLGPCPSHSVLFA